MKTLKNLFFTAVMLISVSALAQHGTIEGRVLNEDGQPIDFANVFVESGVSNTGTMSDSRGIFKLKPLNPGVYSIKISVLGKQPTVITGINVHRDQITRVEDVVLETRVEILDGATIVEHRTKIIDPENTSKIPINKDILKKLPVSSSAVSMAASLSTEISLDDNNQMIIRGARPGSSSLYMDGVKVGENTGGVSRLAIGDMEIYTGGVPAKYGDFTGGVVIMRTTSYFDLLNEYKSRQSRMD
ncbi:MAG: carboxypeptidase regulatory-like domain-containing protein [Bacteroidales bacterium]